MLRLAKAAAWLWFAPCLVPAAECPPADAQPAKAKAQELKREADSALAQGRIGAAASHYKQAVCLDPANPALFYGLGVTQAGLGELDEAWKALERADQLRPESEQALGMLAQIALKMGAIPRLKTVLRAGAERFPHSAGLHTEWSRILAESQKDDLALAEMLRALSAGEAGADNLLELARLENAVGDYAGAVREALTVENRPEIRGEPRAAAAFAAGRGYMGLELWKEAIEQLQLAIRTNPARETPYLALALAYEREENYTAAVETLNQRQRNVPDAVPMLLALGSDLVWAGHYEDGARLLEQSIAKSPNDWEAYTRLAEAYRRSGQPEREIRILQELARRKPDYPMVHVLLAQALIAAGDDHEPSALAELALAEEASPGDPDIFRLRGQLYLRQGHPRDAIRELSRAAALRPGDVATHYQLGLAYQRIGQEELTHREMELARRLKEIAGGK